ncbi:MAG: restriction endonuclease subunit S [Methylobacter sp.]|nr:restriction endonuclease subunit S [Methylobacter sp.]
MSRGHKALGSLLEISGKDRARENNYPVMSITMKYGLIDQSDKFKKRIASQDTENYRVVYLNELVVGFPIDEGVLGFQTKYPAAIVSPAYEIWKLKSETESYLPYLERILRSPQARSLYASKMQGAVARRRSLKRDDFLTLKIPYPTFKDQIRIATLLSRVEILITTRKDNLRLLDEFLKSTFLETFGDPVRNEKGWEQNPCNKIVEQIVSGTSYGGEDRNLLEENEMGVLKISAVTTGSFDSKEIKAVKKDIITKKLVTVKKGDFLFSRANTVELVAACCIVAKDYDNLFIPDKLWRLSFNLELINPTYFNFLLKNNSFRNSVRKLASGGHDSMLNISMKKFLTLSIPTPPVNLQNQFAAIVKKAESLKNHYQKNLIELENLYGALSQKAFKGELDLTRIPLNHKILADLENDQDEVVATVVVVPENISTTLTTLNAFNQSATSLKAIERAARVSSFDLAQQGSVKQAAAQLAVYRSPLEQLKNMSTITSAMEHLESVMRPLNLSQFDSISRSVELARNMTSAIPKIDMGWLEQHNDVLKYAAAPFEAMHSTMAKIESLNYDRINSISKKLESALGHTTAIPISNSGLSDQYSEALRKMTDPFGDMRNAVERASASSIYTQATKWLQSPIPDVFSWQKLACDPLAMYLEEYNKQSFHHEDVIDILSSEVEPISFDTLMQQLGESETVDFTGYETIKTILFDLLTENIVTQVFDEKQKILLFSLAEDESKQ